jgi:Zn-dependent protease with chaperone function
MKKRSRTSSRSFWALAASGLASEGVAAWLAYAGAARALPCRFGPAQTIVGRSLECPVPVILVGHDSFVPAVLLGALVLASLALFALSFVGIAVATARARRACAKCRTRRPVPIKAEVTAARSPKWLVVVEEPSPVAYCIGLLRPWVELSSGLLDRLSGPGVRAVLAHEASHRRRRDPLRAALGRSLARGLFFVPSLRDLADATLAENEISADLEAASLAGRENLAAALLAMLKSPAPPGSAPMATEDLLQVRLDALETNKRPAVRPKRARLVMSALFMGALLAAGAWLPRYPAAHVVRSPSPTVPAVPPARTS